jgi:hypothetical protein
MLIIPEAQGRQLASPSDRVWMTVGDGRRVKVDTWDGTLEIGELTLEVPVHALRDQFIIGREVLDRMEICFEFGRQVRLRFQ